LREKADALETASRLKSEFVANMSYELRTPLNAIVGFAEILTKEYFGPLNSRQLDYGRGILDSSHQLMSLIDNVLDLATIEAGYIVLERGEVAVAELLHAMAGLTRERARSRGLELGIDCPPAIGTVEADGRRLKQALFNLVSNAIKFTPPGGAITLAAERSGGDLLLSVSDTGIGIAPADRERVFGKFERGQHQPGAGLGLSLVRSLIELHGGSVTIESALDRGTRVTCRVPTGRRVPDTGTAAPASRRQRNRRSVRARPASETTAETLAE
jgi:signal transduction histidine kinase